MYLVASIRPLVGVFVQALLFEPFYLWPCHRSNIKTRAHCGRARQRSAVSIIWCTEREQCSVPCSYNFHGYGISEKNVFTITIVPTFCCVTPQQAYLGELLPCLTFLSFFLSSNMRQTIFHLWLNFACNLLRLVCLLRSKFPEGTWGSHINVLLCGNYLCSYQYN